MDFRISKLLSGIRTVGFGFLVGTLVMGGSGTVVEAALLDGVMGGFEESMGKRAQAKGEQLVIGNFYPAERPDSHGPIGAMGDHTHNEGEFMFSYRFMRMFMEGNRDGTKNLSKSDVLDDFIVTPTEMTTQMHMFGFMYGLNQTVTLTAMIPYVLKSMDHVTRAGGKFTTKSSGFGDIRLGSLIRLYAFETPSIGSHRFHLNAAVGLPTGDIKAQGATPLGVVRLPYPMQLGSGTVDLFPGLTYGGNFNNASWGLQAIGTIRLGDNNQGYAMGDEYEINAWGAYRWIEWLSTSFRFKWKDWSNYEGEDPNIAQRNPAGVRIVHTADPNRRAGERLDIFGGFNVLFPEVLGYENHLGFEFGVPIYQKLDGPQLESDYTFFVGWQIIN